MSTIFQTCEVCQRAFTVETWRLKRGRVKYCSYECRNRGRGVTAETRAKMSVAQQARGPRSAETRTRMSAAQQRSPLNAVRAERFRTLNIARTGELIPPELRRLRGKKLQESLRERAGGVFQYEIDVKRTHLPEYKAWRQAVFKKDGYRCSTCGATGYLEAHHVLSWAKHPDQRYVVSNGITLCRPCHGQVDPQRRRKA
jgi:hypothetical protein